MPLTFHSLIAHVAAVAIFSIVAFAICGLFWSITYNVLDWITDRRLDLDSRSEAICARTGFFVAAAVFATLALYAHQHTDDAEHLFTQAQATDAALLTTDRALQSLGVPQNQPMTRLEGLSMDILSVEGRERTLEKYLDSHHVGKEFLTPDERMRLTEDVAMRTLGYRVPQAVLNSPQKQLDGIVAATVGLNDAVVAKQHRKSKYKKMNLPDLAIRMALYSVIVLSLISATIFYLSRTADLSRLIQRERNEAPSIDTRSDDTTPDPEEGAGEPSVPQLADAPDKQAWRRVSIRQAE